MFVRRFVSCALLLSIALAFAGCGAGSKSSSTGGSQNPALTITPATLPTGYVGSNYASTTLKASGGSGTGYTWSISGSGALPAGIALSSAGVVAGKPTADGTSSFTVKVTDSAGASATAQFSIVVKAGVTISTAATLPDAYVGSAYSQTLAASGGTGTGYTWTVNSGSTLPDGLALSAAGVLSGKPTAAGSASFSVTVTDSAQNTATAQLSDGVKAGISVLTAPTLPPAYVGSRYAQQLTATGGSGSGYTWSLLGAPANLRSVRRMAASGLPTGLTLSADGWITGTPNTPGQFLATVIVTDSASNTASMDLSFTIDGGITITTASTLPGGNQGDIYSVKFTATGGTGSGYTWTVASGTTVPGGLRLSADGILSGGLPAANTYTFGVTVTDSGQNTATATFTLVVGNQLRFATGSTLLSAYAGANYLTVIAAKGGSGHGYTFTVSAGSSLPAGLTLSTGGVLSGKPTATGTYQFKVTVTDSASNTAEGDFSLPVVAGVTITTAPTLPSATMGTPYTQALAVTGGTGSGYIWTMTGGSASLSSVGLSFANGVVSGTPTSTGTATFSVSVTDPSLTVAAGTFTVAVAAAGTGFPLSGHIMLGNTCGNVPIPAITLTIDTNPVKTVTTDGAGNYSFSGIANGSYTIKPSIAGAQSIFYPASLPVTVNGGAISNLNFTASLAYTVSGTVNYSGTETGRIYIWLLNNQCGGDPLGTSISSPGNFTVNGVPPGSYILGAGIDSLGFGYQNDVDAAGRVMPDITVSNADLTGQTITMTDPTESALAAGPVINSITPNDDGVVVNFSPITGPHSIFGKIELPLSYEVQWALSSTPQTLAGSATFKAGGANGTGVLILNDPNLLPGQTYIFRMRGVNQTGNGPWTPYPGSVTVSAPAGNQVSGAVTFSATPTGPLYVGYYDVSSGAVFATRIQNPSSPQAFSVSIPTGQTYFHFAILDQNNDGMIDPGDISNTRNDNVAPAPVTGTLTGQNLTLNTPASKASVTTQHVKSTDENGTLTETYSLTFEVREGNKLPVAVRLLNGPHILNPIDLGKCLDCQSNQFRYDVSTFTDLPAVGDSYGLQVTYGDNTTEILTAQVTAMLNAFATDLAPAGTSDTSLKPTFTWTYPANANQYTYQFFLNDEQGHMVWQIPGNSSSSGGFPSTVTWIQWGTDPTNGGSTPNVLSLTNGVKYNWQIQVMDQDGNTTQQRVYYLP